MASIKEVAVAAGVSVSTVSRALNGYTDVREDTRKKIMDIAQELGYRPSQSARNLSSMSLYLSPVWEVTALWMSLRVMF